MQFASAAYSMAETCLYYGEGYIADPAKCNGWGYCSGGELIAQGDCPGTYLYNSKTGQCDYPDKVECASKLESTCSTVTSPIYVADPDDCTKACYCNDGKYKCEKCPEYQVFNPTTRSCVYSSQYACPADSICRLVPNGKWVSDPDACGNYITCVDGSGTSQKCPNDLFYNQFTNTCSSTDICAPSTNPPTTVSAGPGVDKNLPDSTTACAKNPGTKEPFFVSDGQTCMGFYSCETVGAETGVWAKCPMGTHFDEANQACVTPYTVDCPYDRCGNINQNFVSVLGCQDYYYCINQTKQPGMGGNCKTNNANYPYFSEVQNACVNADPGYAICKATPPSPVGN
ncbi:peritrophin-44-like [Musca vetustissima]|uniref:peritrophin-44-like n=1 Tax=Musca vetustissima TaxID=27455 RepID=UPI002AB6D8F3|nr:peritrophin-44-like [Musca vetustissima]